MRELLSLLFPYLVLFYLIDCVTSVGPGGVLFASPLGRRFRLRGAGLRLVGTLPVSRSFLLRRTPVFLTGRGAWLPPDEGLPPGEYREQDLRAVPYERIAAASAAGSVALLTDAEGRVIPVRFPSDRTASLFAASVRAMAGAPPGERRALSGALVARAADLSALRADLARIRRGSAPLAVLSAALFACLYLLIPLALYAKPFRERDMGALAAAVVIIHILCLFATARAHRSVFPDGGNGRARFVLPLLLLPPGASHALDGLHRDALAGYDPLPAAAALLPPGAFRDMARRELVRLRLSLPGIAAPDLADHLRTRERALLGLLADAGLSGEALLAPPRRQDPYSDRYCPMCGTEYLEEAERCGDCGVALDAFGGSGGEGRESPCVHPPRG